MSGKEIGLIILAAAVTAVIVVLVLRMLGVEGAGVIAGGVAGGVTGALGGSFAAKRKQTSR
jgi:hypothetical protein